MKLKIALFFLVISTFLVNNILGQNQQKLIRIDIGAAYDFQKEKVIQNFSIDFNRTERIDEKKGNYFLYSPNNYYIRPTADINIGNGVTTSENNILFQVNMGKAFLGENKNCKGQPRKTIWNKAIEFNPSYNSDKLFQEKLTFGELKLLINPIATKHKFTTEDENDIYLHSVHSLALGVFSNLGYRFSKTNNTDAFYSTAGILIDYQTRILNIEKKNNWVFNVFGNYYYIISDVRQLTTDNFAGIIKSSINKKIFKDTFIGLSYKYGNDNPYYQYIHVLELSAKIAY